ncbi:hypothetical protein KUTeg_004307 [Tegillarca granosa]|uniref:t-SNARE coiled-coil homology domain-containing protein n=1 Tax=Tegillarca granosa TaxID=220873 RepID=A0ABQ9FR51_TEGGR|nr:hypothetical protein KUTeg_004307 [Tegillarca granosa]
MASLIESYEQQYSNLTADITYNISRISNTNGAERQKYIRQAEKLFDEVTELLEQMELEVKELPSKDKQKYQTRVKSYKTELTKLQKDTRARLLDNTETLDRSTRKLEHGYRVALETEQIGAQVMEDLQGQRQTIQRSRNRLEEMNTNLGKSSRVLSGMMKRIIQNRLLLVIIGVILVIVIILAMYFIVKRKT